MAVGALRSQLILLYPLPPPPIAVLPPARVSTLVDASTQASSPGALRSVLAPSPGVWPSYLWWRARAVFALTCRWTWGSLSLGTAPTSLSSLDPLLLSAPSLCPWASSPLPHPASALRSLWRSTLGAWDWRLFLNRCFALGGWSATTARLGLCPWCLRMGLCPWCLQPWRRRS